MKLLKKVIYPKQKIKAFKFTVKSIFRSSNWLIQKYFLRGDSEEIISNFDVLLFPNLKMAATWKSDKMLLCQNHLVTHSTANWLTAVFRKVLGATLIVEKGNSKLVYIIAEVSVVSGGEIPGPTITSMAASVCCRGLIEILKLKSCSCFEAEVWSRFLEKLLFTQLLGRLCLLQYINKLIWKNGISRISMLYIAFVITKHFLLFQH